ncbi:MAG: ATP-binding cassette domain-containing protein [Acidimicrobiales bacterium]
MIRAARRPVVLLGGLLVVYLAAPLVAFAIRLSDSPHRGFHQAGLFSALWVSVSGATISLALITAFGVPLAYVLARSKSRWAAVVGVIVQIPLAMPPLMSGIILIYVVGPYTFLGRLFDRRLTNSMAGVVIAMTFVAAPFLVVAARSAFAALDQSLFDVAATLGHGEVGRFWRVAVPAASGGVRAGMVLSWLRAFGEYGAVVVLAFNPTTLPVYTYNQFSGTGLPTTLAPTALAVAVAVVVVLLARAHAPRRRHEIPDEPSQRPTLKGESAPVHFQVERQLGDFHLRVEHLAPARHVAVLGPSGAGKSVLLRGLAGLYGVEAGVLVVGADPLGDQRTEERHVGYVAQGFSLFPHLTVWQQLLFPRGATPDLAAYWLAHLSLQGLENRRPNEISGGQRQRVALAQTLCASPRVLLLDEPLSALDVPTRLQLRRELRQLQRDTGLATILVTHDPEEAAFLAEEVIVLSEGRQLQSGPSRQVFTRPASPEVARLLGVANLHYAHVLDPGVLEVAGQRLVVGTPSLPTGTRVAWSVRPETLGVSATIGAPVPGGVSVLAGVVSDLADVGTAVDLFVAIGAEVELQVRITAPLDLSVGQACGVLVPSEAVSLWPLESDAVLALD